MHNTRHVYSQAVVNTVNFMGSARGWVKLGVRKISKEVFMGC